MKLLKSACAKVKGSLILQTKYWKIVNNSGLILCWDFCWMVKPLNFISFLKDFSGPSLDCGLLRRGLLVPERCELWLFFPGYPYVPGVKTIWARRKLGHKHALPIDSPIILDAIFADGFWTSHLEVLHAIHWCTHLEGVVVGPFFDGSAKHFKTQSYALATTPEAYRIT